MPIPGWEAKPCPNFPGMLLLACEFNGGGPMSWKWLVCLKNAFWVNPKKRLKEFIDTVVTPRD